MIRSTAGHLVSVPSLSFNKGATRTNSFTCCFYCPCNLTFTKPHLSIAPATPVQHQILSFGPSSRHSGAQGCVSLW
eukprot:96780-Amphidinium_carterae.1